MAKRKKSVTEPPRECPNCDGKGYEIWMNDHDGYDHEPCNECGETGINPEWEQWRELQEARATGMMPE